MVVAGPSPGRGVFHWIYLLDCATADCPASPVVSQPDSAISAAAASVAGNRAITKGDLSSADPLPDISDIYRMRSAVLRAPRNRLKRLLSSRPSCASVAGTDASKDVGA